MYGVHTYSCQTTRTFTNCGATANQTNDKEQCAYSYYYDSRNQSVYILKEVVVVVISDKHIGSNVAQNPSCSLQRRKKKKDKDNLEKSEKKYPEFGGQKNNNTQANKYRSVPICSKVFWAVRLSTYQTTCWQEEPSILNINGYTDK